MDRRTFLKGVGGAAAGAAASSPLLKVLGGPTLPRTPMSDSALAQEILRGLQATKGNSILQDQVIREGLRLFEEKYPLSDTLTQEQINAIPRGFKAVPDGYEIDSLTNLLKNKGGIDFTAPDPIYNDFLGTPDETETLTIHSELTGARKSCG